MSNIPLNLIVTLLSISGSIITIISSFLLIKFKVETLEKRVELIETKELQNINAILITSQKETQYSINKLSDNISTVSKAVYELALKFKIKVEEV